MENSTNEKSIIKEDEKIVKENAGKIKVKDKVVSVASSIGKTTTEVAKKATEGIEKGKEAVFQAIDQNGDGEVGIDDVIIMGLKVPGIRINREEFLRKELFKRFWIFRR